MAEYIDRDKLAAKLCERCDLHCDIKTEHCEIVGEIMMQTPADVVKVVHGKWVHRKNGVAYCSECNTDAVEDGTDYCPNCGARMDGE